MSIPEPTLPTEMGSPQYDQPQSPIETPVRKPRKSILKAKKCPSIKDLRPLARTITDIFPLELFRLIIDALQNDRRALASCSLVCRAWLPFCRDHFNPHLMVQPENASRFKDLLASPHISVKTSVRHLTLQKQQNVVDHVFLVNSPTNSPTSEKPSPQFPRPQLQLSDILSQATLLPYITKLTFQKGYGEGSAMASHLREFLYLEDLEIRSFEFVSFADLTAVLSAQPNLRRLSLTDIAWGGQNSTAPTSAHSTLPSDANNQSKCVLPNLRRLELFMEQQAKLFNWILGKPSIPSVEYVEIGGITDVDDAIAVSRFLRTLGPVLKHLRLYSPNRISQGKILTLSSLPIETHNELTGLLIESISQPRS